MLLRLLHLAKLDRVQKAAEKMCGCSFQALADRREAAVFSLICKLLDGECVEPLQKFAPEFAAAPVGEVKTRLQHKAASDTSDTSTVLNNELNANLFNWIEYAVKWNTNKTQLLS